MRVHRRGVFALVAFIAVLALALKTATTATFGVAAMVAVVAAALVDVSMWGSGLRQMFGRDRKSAR